MTTEEIEYYDSLSDEELEEYFEDYIADMYSDWGKACAVKLA